MSVVQITKACTLKCTYCFDKVWQEQAKSKQANITISRSNFDKYLSRMWEFFQDKTDDKNICVSWWEPTLHPLFTQFITWAVNSNYHVYLLSNFTFTEKVRKFLYSYIQNWDVTCMVNVNSPTGTYAWMTKALWIKTMINLTALQHPWVRLSFNIFDPDIDYEFIFDTLKKLPNVDKMVRLWVVNPILSDLRKNETFVFDNIVHDWQKESTWEFYQRLWKVTDVLVERLTKLGYSVYLDCWVGWCIFSPETLTYIRQNNWIIHWCSLPNDEVSTDSQYSSCYTLFSYWNEDRFLNLQNISIKKSRWWFILKTEFFKKHYLILPKCMTCPLLKEGCPRFCVSNNIYFWETIFWKNWENISIYKDTIKNYTWDDNMYKYLRKVYETYPQNLNFTECEYLLSRGLYDMFESHIERFDHTSHIRYWLYKILYMYLSEKVNKKEALELFQQHIQQFKHIEISDIDIDLVRITSILLKEYRSLRDPKEHNTHSLGV